MKRTIKKAQRGDKIDMTAMTKAMAKNKDIKPSDTLAVNDPRREDFGNIDKLDKRDQRKIADLDNAFNKKYGKGKPAKQKMGGVTKKKLKMGGAVKKGNLVAAGVTKTTKKAPMVDPKGAYTKVQQRTLGNMKKGGKMSKKK